MLLLNNYNFWGRVKWNKENEVGLALILVFLLRVITNFRGDTMTYFLVTFVLMLIVIAIMAIGVIFGRRAIKGSCGGGMSKAECVCVEKCDKRKKMDAEANLIQGS